MSGGVDLVKKAIVAEVVIAGDEDNHRLIIVCEDNVLEFLVDNQSVFLGDWDSNFKDVFREALELWKNDG